jgi:hypothetical protein
MNYSIWLTATAMVGMGSFVVPAYADSLAPTPRSVPSMEYLVIVEPQRSDRLESLADEISRRMGPSDDGITSVNEAIQSPLLDRVLDQVLDENGELNLPLGLTVYSTMGDTSVGFGTKF